MKTKLQLACFALMTLAGARAAAQDSVTVTYYHSDQLGSPAVATDASGNVVFRETYAPYGKRTQNQPGISGHVTGYTGHALDTASGLTYMAARYYDPKLGRFLSIDPAPFTPENIHSFNRYAYANGNPEKYIDPTGREGEEAQSNVADYLPSPGVVGGAIAISPCITEPLGCVEYAKDFIKKWNDPGNAARAAAEREISHSMIPEAKRAAELALRDKIAQLAAAGDEAAAQLARAELAAMELANREKMTLLTRIGQSFKAVYFMKYTGATPGTVELVKSVLGKASILANPYVQGAMLLFHSPETGGCDSSGRCRDMIYRDKP